MKLPCSGWMSPAPLWNTYIGNLAGKPRWWNNAVYSGGGIRNGQVCICWQVECMKRHITGEWRWNTEEASWSSSITSHSSYCVPWPVIPLEIKAKAHGNGSHCLLIRQRGIQHNHLALVCILSLFMQQTLFGGKSYVERIHLWRQLIKLQLALSSTSLWFITCCRHLPAAPCQS